MSTGSKLRYRHLYQDKDAAACRTKASGSFRDLSEMPFGVGPGEYLARGLANRSQRVAACLALGEPAPFERVRPPGYAREIERCTRCLTLKKQHKTNEEI